MKTPAEHFAEGLGARQQGLPISACQLVFRAWPYECWQLGWRFADIEQTVETGSCTETPLERITVRPFDQGAVARLKDIAFADCPYEPGSNDGIQWQAGWIASVTDNSQPIGCRVILTWLLITAVIIAFMWASYFGYI